MMDELLYVEDTQGFFFRLLRQGHDRWPLPHCITQQDYLCLKLLRVHDLGGKEMQRLREALADPSLCYMRAFGIKNINVQRLREAHRLIVLKALRCGWEVPDTVLDDYPSLRDMVVQVVADGSAQVCLYEQTLILSQQALLLFHQLSSELATCSTLYQHQTDPYPEPKHLLGLRNPGSADERAWYAFDRYCRQLRSLLQVNDPLSYVMTRLINNEIAHLCAWFQSHGYDEAHIPAPPVLDHMTGYERPGGWGSRPAIVFGQIGCSGFEDPKQGGVTMFLNTPGYMVACWNALQLWPRQTLWTHKKTEEVWAIAREISLLTDWAVAFEQPRPVKRAILAKLRSLVEPHQGWIAEDFVKRFQIA